jgi:hypothetical protein
MSKLGAHHRSALEMLAECSNGCTDHVLHLFGFSEKVIADLIRAGLARAEPKRSFPKRRAFAVQRVRITGAGRQALK